MAFTILNATDSQAVTYPALANPQKGDFDILSGAEKRTGVLSSVTCTAAASGTDRSISVPACTVEIMGRTVRVSAQTITSANNPVDGSNPRLNLVRVSTLGVASVDAGTAGASQQAYPTIDTTNFAYLAVCWLPAAATSITNTNILAKDVVLERRQARVGNTRLSGPIFNPARGTRRTTHCRFGPPGVDGGGLTSGVEYTLFDSASTSDGGITGYTASPGIVHSIAWVGNQGTNLPQHENGTWKIYYDGESTATMIIPHNAMYGGFNQEYSSVSFRHELMIQWNYGAANFSTHMIPMPWQTSIKITFTPAAAGATKCWTRVEATLGDAGAYAGAKLRNCWWGRSNGDISGALTTSDRAATDSSTSRWSTSSTSGIDSLDSFDYGLGTRLQASMTNSTTTMEVYNGAALIRGLKAGTDPRTGTAITLANTSGGTLAPDVFVMVEDECMKVTSISSNTCTVVRGQTHPITGASTTAVSHTSSGGIGLLGCPAVRRIVGPGRIVGHIQYINGYYNSNNYALEGPTAYWIDGDSVYGTYGNVGVVGGGTEDFYNNGWYNGQGVNRDSPNMGLAVGIGAYEHLYYRWFLIDPLYFDESWNFTWTNGESGQGGGTPGATPSPATIWWYGGY